MNLTILHQEKKLHPFYRKALKEYDKRLQRYCKIQLVYCSSSPSLQKKISNKGLIIGITIAPSSHTSEALADDFSHLAVRGHSRISYIINPSPDLLQQCDECISLSQLITDTGLMLTVLYEQIYRAYRINLNQAYHK